MRTALADKKRQLAATTPSPPVSEEDWVDVNTEEDTDQDVEMQSAGPEGQQASALLYLWKLHACISQPQLAMVCTEAVSRLWPRSYVCSCA